jgi:hypothetical protein
MLIRSPSGVITYRGGKKPEPRRRGDREDRMTVATNRVEDELGRKRLVFYVPDNADREEWIDITAKDTVLTGEKR